MTPELKKALETDYPLIPMDKITEEARTIAVQWHENATDWIGDKHKLASDIMNYARRNPPDGWVRVEDLTAAMREELSEANQALNIASGFTDDDYKYLGVLAASIERIKNTPSPENKDIVKVPLASYNHDTEVFKKQQARIKELEDAVKNTTEIASNMLTKVSVRAMQLEGLVSYFSTISATVHFANADKQHEYNAKLREAKALLPPALAEDKIIKQ